VIPFRRNATKKLQTVVFCCVHPSYWYIDNEETKMKEFVTILHEEPQDLSGYSPTELQRMLEEYMQWTKDVRKHNMLVAEKNLDNSSGAVIRGFGDDAVITDGPYAETKEIIGGLHIIRAESLEEAVEWARRCPALAGGGAVEVRAIEAWGEEE
jgi:hypothetical protein